MKTYTPPKKILILWHIRSLILLIMLSLITLWVWFLTVYFAIVIGVAVLLMAVLNFIYLPLYLSRYSVTVSSEAIVIKSGVIIHREQIMPIPRMVYVQRLTTPLARAFSVSALSLRATRAMLITLELKKSDIEEIIGENA